MKTINDKDIKICGKDYAKTVLTIITANLQKNHKKWYSIAS